MKNTWLIGWECKRGDALSGPALIGRGLDQHCYTRCGTHGDMRRGAHGSRPSGRGRLRALSPNSLWRRKARFASALYSFESAREGNAALGLGGQDYGSGAGEASSARRRAANAKELMLISD